MKGRKKEKKKKKKIDERKRCIDLHNVAGEILPRLHILEANTAIYTIILGSLF